MSVFEMYEKRPRRLILYLATLFVILALVVWSSSAVKYNGVTATGAEVAYGMVHGLTHPDPNMLFSLSTDAVPYMLFQTIAIAFLGTIFGAVLAVPVSFLASENVSGKVVSRIVRILILLIRTIPSLVWALVWIRVTGPGAFCGVVTQSVCSIGMISKMFITAIEDIDTGILESLDAAGCNTLEKIRVGVLPQLYANFVSSTIYRFDINIKDASILGMVGAGGIGAALIQSINSRRWSIVGSFMFGLIVLVMIIELFSTKIRRNLASGE